MTFALPSILEDILKSPDPGKSSSAMPPRGMKWGNSCDSYWATCVTDWKVIFLKKLFFRELPWLSEWRRSCDSTTAILSQGDYQRWKRISVEHLNLKTSSIKSFQMSRLFFTRGEHLFKVEEVWRSHHLVRQRIRRILSLSCSETFYFLFWDLVRVRK